MYLPGGFSEALLLTILSAVFWGSWANTYKGTKQYPFELFYWDYILGVVLCTFVFAFTLGSHGSTGESFVENLHAADPANLLYALVAGAIFNVANLLLVAAVDIAGLAIAFPLSIGIAVVEGVVLSYAIQPKGNIAFLACGIAFAIAAVLFDARAYETLTTKAAASRVGIVVSLISGVLMGGFAPFVTTAMTRGHPLTCYSVAALFSVGALLCSFIANVYFMKHPIRGAPVSFSGYWRASARNHLLGLLGGIAWGIGGCFNFIAAGFVGVPISYAIGQSAPLIAASWGVFVWHEFANAPKRAWVSLRWMFVLYIAAICLIAYAHNG
jgi:glucose uptake protein